jgi:hypothetical protein
MPRKPHMVELTATTQRKMVNRGLVQRENEELMEQSHLLINAQLIITCHDITQYTSLAELGIGSAPDVQS